MKPAPFDYAAPTSLDEALALLGDDAKPLAGGQSLVPLLNFRLARPRLVVDLNGVAGLAGIRRVDGALRIGALTRQSALERSAVVADGWPVLRDAVRHVAHAAIRNRGTVGGSVAHADPAAELPCALVALDARFHVRSTRGARTLAADAFFVGPLQSALEPDELLTEIEVPPIAAATLQGFAEYARTHGDFALACAAVVGERVALGGVGPTPLAVTHLDEAHIADPYRRALVAELVRRARA
ncbi:MAG: FAD binding domain-containing protein [Actinomycetota bacterium]